MPIAALNLAAGGHFALLSSPPPETGIYGPMPAITGLFVFLIQFRKYYMSEPAAMDVLKQF
jgi:hypothetical protein